MGAGGAAAGGAAAGSSMLGPVMGAGGAASGAGLFGNITSMLPAGMQGMSQLQGAADAGGGDGFWLQLGQVAMGDPKKPGSGALAGLADFGDLMSRQGMMEGVQHMRHSSQPPAPYQNSGLQGLFNQVSASQQGGWGRVR